MGLPDPALIAQRLGTLYGLRFSGSPELIEGGLFPVIRPDDLARPNGFGVVVARTPRQVEASFRMDSFARGLLRHMADSDDVARATFAALVTRVLAEGFQVTVGVNGNRLEDPALLPDGEWLGFELDCCRRLPAGKTGTGTVHEQAFAAASACMGLILSLLPIEDISEWVAGVETGLPEGARLRVEMNRYERNPLNRAACIAHHGARCQACGLEFRHVYGALGAGFIEVHHRIPVSAMGGSYRIDPLRDLVPVCSNCHAMLHRQDPPLTVEELRSLVKAGARKPDTN